MRKRKFFVCAAAALLLAGSLRTPVKAQEEIELSAPSAVLMEASTGRVLYEKNSHEVRPCASITKVMTLCLAFDAIDEGRLSLTDTLSASAHAASMGGSDIWLKEGEQMTVDDLLKATVIMSANDAAVVLAEHIAGSEEAFVARMNEKAQQLGMEDTVFQNCNGLDEEGHVTSAHDVALMSRELITHPKIFDYTLTWIDYVRDGKTQLVNTNKLIRSYQGITGLKTGTTSKAGSCITATAERDGLSLICVILGADSTDHRFRDASVLLDHGFANWVVTVPQLPKLPPVAVKGAMEETIPVKTGQAPKILTRVGEAAKIEETIQWREELKAPIEEGEEIGTIYYSISGERAAQIPIIAAQTAEPVTFSSSFFCLLGELFRF